MDIKNIWNLQIIYGVTYGNNTFVAVGDGWNILTSSNGTSWTSRTSGTNMRIDDVIFGKNIFVVVAVGELILLFKWRNMDFKN